MTKEGLIFSGWFCIVGLIASIPLALLRTVVFLKAGLPLSIFSLVFTAIISMIAAYVWLALRQMLNDCYRFTSADKAISGLLVMLAVWGLFDVLEVFFPQLQFATNRSFLTFLLLIVRFELSGVFYILLARQLTLLHDAPPVLKVYGAFCLVSGVLMCTIVLVPLAAVVGIIGKIVLALVFWETAKNYRSAYNTV